MSPIPCRIVLADHASRLSFWGALATELGPQALMQIDPRPFAPWDVSALSLTFQVGPDRCSLLDILPALSTLQCCSPRLCYARELQHLLVILERKERTLFDPAAMEREVKGLIEAAPACHCDPLPYNGVCRNGLAPRPGLLRADAAVCLPPGKPLLVLVEDEMLVRGLIQRILHNHFLVIESAGGLDALNLAERLPMPIHMLLSDVSLPGLDGIGLAQRWRQRRPESRILLLSGNSYVPVDPEVDFLQKPFFADELLRRVLRQAAPAPLERRA